MIWRTLLVLLGCCGASSISAQTVPTADGYRGIWYSNQPQDDAYKFKYSGGFATYPQQHAPIAIYSKEANKTFFVFGGKAGEQNVISNMVSYYDHATGQVPRPRIVLTRKTNDTHYNPTLSIDAAGYVYVFCNSHGTGYELKKDDPTHGKSFIYRSSKPYSIESFEPVREDNFSYSQPWLIEGKGLLWLHTRYLKNRRRIFWAASEDGITWSEPRQMMDMAQGSYQVSWAQGDRLATACDFHPEKVGLNGRTNIYYLETRDFGQTWTTVSREKLNLPLSDPQNPALIHDFQKDKLLVYLKDLTFDETGKPVILYLTSRGYKSGPEADPRTWYTARWDGAQWVYRRCFESDHNYDHGSLYIEAGGVWRIIAPTEPGPQPFGTGGQIGIHLSKDQGQTWVKVKSLGLDTGRNQTYVRRPRNAHNDFYGYWADGDAFGLSESDLYFCNSGGRAFRLPRKMEGDFAKPQPLDP